MEFVYRQSLTEGEIVDGNSNLVFCNFLVKPMGDGAVVVFLFRMLAFN